MATINKTKPSDAAAVAGLDPSADPSEAPSDDEVKTIAQRIKAARSTLVDPVDLSSFNKAEDDAKQLYQDKASRAEWLGVADRIGQNLIRMNAANQGLSHNVDMSHVDLGPGNDWEKVTDRYGKDYSTDLEKNNHDRAAALTNQQQQTGLAEKAFDIASRDKAMIMQQKRAEEAQKHSDDRQDKSLKEAGERQEKSLNQQERLRQEGLLAQQKLQDEREQASAERLRKASALKDADEDVRQGTKSDLAMKTLSNQLTADSDLGKKNREDLEKQYGKLAAEAGVDLGSLQEKLKSQETFLPGWLGGKSGAEELKDKKVIVDTELQRSRSLLDAYKERKKALLGGSGAPAVSAPPPPPPPPPPDGTVKVKGPSGSVATMSKEAAAKYLTKPGYSQVP